MSFFFVLCRGNQKRCSGLLREHLTFYRGLYDGFVLNCGVCAAENSGEVVWSGYVTVLPGGDAFGVVRIYWVAARPRKTMLGTGLEGGRTGGVAMIPAPERAS